MHFLNKEVSMRIILASNNKGKIAEMKKILEPIGFEVVSQSEAGVHIEVEETGMTFEENAELKARAIYKLRGEAVISDDSGLEVDFLNKAPGVYSARYAGENATDKDRNEKLLKELINVTLDKRTARFVCVIHYISKAGDEHSFRGECEGHVGFEPSGENGFGYDPVFYIGEKSFAEISSEEKNIISHRAKALKKLTELLEGNGHKNDNK